MKNSLLIVFFAALLGFAFSPETGSIALDVPSAIASDKVTICHYPPGTSNPQTLEIAVSALITHEDHHGDTMGACPSCECLPGISTCVCSDGASGSPSSESVSPPSSQRNLHGQ